MTGEKRIIRTRLTRPRRSTLAAIAMITSSIAGMAFAPSPAVAAAGGPEPVAELRPGILEGYLSEDDFPDSLALLPPPPRDGSAAAKVDAELNAHLLTLQQSPRFELAALDNNLHFPAAAGTFACALGIDISKEGTPYLYQLLRRTLTDAGLSTYGAKNAYQRTRPFVVNKEPNCAPDREQELLKNDGSYPSGHTAIGWAWALILTSLAPERADALLERGMAYGESRMVCNVHWPSDVVAGRIMGAAAVAVLQANVDFQSDLAMAKQEIAAARAAESTPARECALESRALTTDIYPGEAAP